MLVYREPILNLPPSLQGTPARETGVLPLPCPVSHKWPLTNFTVTVHSGISHLKRLYPAEKKGGGKRLHVTNFSRPSRKRLLQKLAEMRNMDHGYFGTFTYPGKFDYTWRECKAHLAALRKRMLRKWSEVRVLWRMEVKPRLSGASEGEQVPHYHLLIFGLPYGHETEIEADLSVWWNEIANNHPDDFAVIRSEVEQIRSRQEATYYASKYCAKVDTGNDEGFGRHWGFFGEWDNSFSERHMITQMEANQLKRLVLRWMKGRAFSRSEKLKQMDKAEKAAEVLKRSKELTRKLARVRSDYGISVFGCGDHDDWTAKYCPMSDMVTCAQRQVQY